MNVIHLLLCYLFIKSYFSCNLSLLHIIVLHTHVEDNRGDGNNPRKHYHKTANKILMLDPLESSENSMGNISQSSVHKN